MAQQHRRGGADAAPVKELSGSTAAAAALGNKLRGGGHVGDHHAAPEVTGTAVLVDDSNEVGRISGSGAMTEADADADDAAVSSTTIARNRNAVIRSSTTTHQHHPTPPPRRRPGT